MTCLCPHCSGSNEIDVAALSEKGTSVNCSSCGKQFWVYRESFAGRALNKTGDIYCVQCGGKLGRSISCPSCGTLYPGFFVTHKTKATRRRVVRSQRSFVFSRRPTFGPRRTYVAVRQQGAKKASPLGRYLLAALVVIAVLVGGGLYLLQVRAEARYSKQYMRALYGVAAGSESGLAVCGKLVAEAGRAAREQRSYVFRISPKDEARLTRIRGEVEKMMPLTNDPPKKFTAAQGKLANLYSVYLQIHALTVEPPRTIKALQEKTGQLEESFRNGRQDLAASLTGRMPEDLKHAKVKYKVLKDF